MIQDISPRQVDAVAHMWRYFMFLRTGNKRWTAEPITDDELWLVTKLVLGEYAS